MIKFHILLNTSFCLLVLKVLKEMASCASKYTEFEAEMSFRNIHIEYLFTD